jgi:hypothetical protein
MNFINKNYFFIRGRRVGYLGDVLIVAELGINHHGSLKLAKKMANLAIKNGADVIKNQTHLADEEMSVEAKKIKPGNSKHPKYKQRLPEALPQPPKPSFWAVQGPQKGALQGPQNPQTCPQALVGGGDPRNQFWEPSSSRK